MDSPLEPLVGTSVAPPHLGFRPREAAFRLLASLVLSHRSVFACGGSSHGVLAECAMPGAGILSGGCSPTINESVPDGFLLFPPCMF